MIETQPRILFLTLSDDIGSERIVSDMGRRGATCAVLGRPRAVAALSVRVSHHRTLPGRGGMWAAAMAVASRLESMAVQWHPDAVVPLDDWAAHLLRDLALAPRTSPGLRRLLVSSLGDPRHYRSACSRGLLVETAASLGVRTPGQRRIVDAAEARAAAADLGFPMMLKREGTCGGSGVMLVRDEAELAEAFRTAERKARAKRALRRLLGFRSFDDGAALTLQAFVAGGLAMRTVACEAGHVLAGMSFAADRLDPPVTGSSTVIRPVDNAEMDEAARRLVAALGCSGFVSFDFLLSRDGRATLIEMNARPVGSGHLAARFGHDLYGAWLKRFPGFSEPPEGRSIEPMPRSVALFPKEMQRDPESPCLLPGPDHLHDIPWDEPRIVASYRDRLMLRHPSHAAAIARQLMSAPDAGRPVQRSDAVAPVRMSGLGSRLVGLKTMP
jgi:hypothetical protein